MESDERKIINALKHDWHIISIAQHAKGYWTITDSSFNLKELKAEEEIRQGKTGELYLSIKGGQNLLLISGANLIMK